MRLVSFFFLAFGAPYFLFVVCCVCTQKIFNDAISIFRSKMMEFLINSRKFLLNSFVFLNFSRAIDVRSSGREIPRKSLESWSQVCSRVRKLVYNKKFIAINYVSAYLTSHIRQRVFFCLIHIFFRIFSKKEDYLHIYSVRDTGCHPDVRR